MTSLPAGRQAFRIRQAWKADINIENGKICIQPGTGDISCRAKENVTEGQCYCNDVLILPNPITYIQQWLLKKQTQHLQDHWQAPEPVHKRIELPVTFSLLLFG